MEESAYYVAYHMGRNLVTRCLQRRLPRHVRQYSQPQTSNGNGEKTEEMASFN
jgi:hypothetical protein